jgi:hypothetical protein
MCTLTFLPLDDGSAIITSNRDEAPGRKTKFPKLYDHSGVAHVYPKDEKAGGTWIGISGHKRLIGLLNGGFTAHTPLGNYRKSRGLVVLDLLTCPDFNTSIKQYDFMGIEPFTMIVYRWEDTPGLTQIVWDGSDLHAVERELSASIWSSTLLYPNRIREKREKWFKAFLKEYPRPNSEQLRKFHHTAGEADPSNDLVMDRGFVRTRSITQVVVGKRSTMWYKDLESGREERLGI